MVPWLLRGRQVWDSQAAYEANHYPLLPRMKERWERPACKKKGGRGDSGTAHPASQALSPGGMCLYT